MSLLKRLFHSKSKSEEKNTSSDHSKYYPQDQLPTDEKFTKNFRKNGGKFLYCESFKETQDNFDNILLENDWYEKDVLCVDKELSKQFDGYNLNFTKDSESTFFFTKCESLIANNGSILLSSNQIKEKKLNELPQNFIVLANTSQLVDSISEGLRNIKNQCKGRIPSNITTIQDFGAHEEKDFMSYGSSTKNLYLLLLEDL
jgi:L-lactate utilization protein LutB